MLPGGAPLRTETRRRHHQAEADDALGVEARIDRPQAVEALRRQPGADQEHDRESDLGDHQAGAQAEAAAAAIRAALLERVDDVEARRLHGGQEPEEGPRDHAQDRARGTNRISASFTGTSEITYLDRSIPCSFIELALASNVGVLRMTDVGGPARPRGPVGRAGEPNAQRSMPGRVGGTHNPQPTTDNRAGGGTTKPRRAEAARSLPQRP